MQGFNVHACNCGHQKDSLCYCHLRVRKLGIQDCTSPLTKNGVIEDSK